MDRKRKNIPSGIRWDVFNRDDFRCVYCGASRKDGAELVIDHGDPFSKGGADDESNYVTACKPCNDGKKAKIIIPPAADEQVISTSRKWASGVPDGAWEESRKCGDWLSAWASKFRVWWEHVDSSPLPVSVNVGDYGSLFNPTLVCEGRDGCDIGPMVRVLVTGWMAIGRIPVEEQMQIRNAVISGYDVPTMIVMGVPDCFYGVLVNERYKGTPRGFVVNEFLQPFGEWEITDWYPDEDGLFQDLRSPFSDDLLIQKQWDFQRETFRGVYSSCEAWGQ